MFKLKGNLLNSIDMYKLFGTVIGIVTVAFVKNFVSTCM
jgi:hypothetical protein